MKYVLFLFAALVLLQPVMGVEVSGNLVGYWDADGDANDSANSFDGQEVNGVAYTNGVFGQTFSLAGTSYIELGSGVMPQKAYTKSAWIRRSNSSSNNILSGSGGANNGHVFYCSTNNGNDSRLSTGHNGAWMQVRSDVPVPLNQWLHVAVTYDLGVNGGTLSVYTNGLPVAGGEGVATNVPAPGDSTLHIGAWNNASTFNGEIDDVGLFDNALSAADIQQIYAVGLGGTNLAGIAMVLPPEQWVDWDACPLDMQVVPRNPSNNMAAVTFSGDVVTNGFEEVALRIYRDEVFAQAATQSLAYAVGRAPFAFVSMIPAELANYDFEVVLRQGGAETLVRRVQDVVGGDFIVIQGQSNAVATRRTGDANVLRGPFLRSFGRNSSQGEASQADTSWVLAEGNLNINQAQGTIGQWGITMARELIDETGIPMAIINGADGGKPIGFFQRNDGDPFNLSTNYGRLLTRMHAMGAADAVRAILWYQGEAEGMNAAAHVAGWTSLYNDWKEDYPSTEQIVVCQLRVGCGVTDKWYTDLRNEQRLLADTFSDVSVMSTTGLDGHDGCHFDYVEGYEELGWRMARLLGRDLYVSGVTNAVDAPNPSHAFFSSPSQDEITLVMRNAHDALIFDAGAENDFRVEGSLATVVNGFASGNEVILTLDGDASDGTGLSYSGHLQSGPWVTNTNGVGLLAFFDEPIELNLLPPDEPTNFTATAINSVRIDLSWAASTNAASYRIFRDAIEVGTTTERVFEDVGLLPDTAYAYAIESFNNLGASSQAFAGAMTPAAPVNPPGTPTGLAGVPLSQTAIGLTWDETPDATSYRVYRDGGEVGLVYTNAFDDSGLTRGTTYTYTVAAENPAGISVQSTGVDVTTVNDNLFANVPEANDFDVLYQLQIPDGANFSGATSVPYEIDRSAQISGAVTRVAYYLELETATGVEWVYTSMDAFTTDLVQLGLPHHVDNPVIWQQVVSNLNVYAGGGAENRVTTGAGIQTGNIEMWPSNYNASNGIGIPGASATLWDFGDGGNSVAAGYGSFQVHNHGQQEVIWAYNRWGTSANPDDLGIGSNTGTAPNGQMNPDWTFMENSANYTAKRLVILVQEQGLFPPSGLAATVQSDTEVQLDWASRPGATGYIVRRDGVVLDTVTTNRLDDLASPATVHAYDVAAVYTNLTSAYSSDVLVTTTFNNVFAYVPEAAGYDVVYHLNLPDAANYRNPNTIPYGIDRSSEVDGMRRIAYFLELDGPAAEHQWVYISMDAFTQDPTRIALPHHNLGYTWKINVANMHVAAGGAAINRVSTGMDITTGNIEAWPNNYGGNNLGGVPNANNSYDVGDYIAYDVPIGHSCFQIHNHGVPETILAYNQWGAGGIDAIGIGSNTNSANTDWTFEQNSDAYSVKSFGILVQPFTVPPVDVPTGLQVVTAGLTRVVLAWDAVAEAQAYQLTRDGVVIAKVMTPEFTDVSLSPGQTYAYRVAALNPLGITGHSPPVMASTLGDLAVYSNVVEAAEYEVIYALDCPDDANYRYHTLPDYFIDRSEDAIGAFDRIAYYLELDDEWVFVSMDAFTSDLNRIALPHWALQYRQRQIVDNMNVLTGGGAELRVTNGVGIATGNIEFWPNSYAQTNTLPIPNASSTQHDFGDNPTGNPGYSSFQVHNHGAVIPHTIFAYNHWGNAGNDDLGIGSRTTNQPDWTFANNAADYGIKRLYVLVRQTNDLDHDGLPDDWEIAAFGNLDQGPGGDPDNDGLTTVQELEAGTDPNNADSVVQLEVLRMPGGERLIRFATELGQVYQVEMRDRIADPVWMPFGPVVTGTGLPVQMMDSGDEPGSVFRLRVE